MKAIFIYIVLLITIIGCENEEAGKSMFTPVDLLPDNNEISGWVSVGSYDEANDYDSLYAIIDGGAQIYIDNGFVSSAFQQYFNSTGSVMAEVKIRIYDQGSEANSSKTYDKVATGIGVPWNGAGMEARIDESALASYTIEFWQKNFFVQVIIEEKTETALNIAKLFATHISGKIAR